MVTEETRTGLRRGSMKAIEALWHDYGPRLRRLCRSLCGNEEQADELTTGCFVRIYDAAVDFSLPDDLEAWLFSTALSALRHVTPRDPNPRHGDESERVDGILATLPADDRLALALHDVQGFSIDRVAALMGERRDAIDGRIAGARVEFLRRWDGSRRRREPNR